MRISGETEKRLEPLRQAATGVAAVAFAFSLFVVVEMFLVWRDMETSRPTDHPRLVALRADLDREAGSETIVAEIRRTETALRTDFHTAEQRVRQGAWLLLIAIASGAGAAKLALSTRRRLPAPIARGIGYDADHGLSLFGRVSVGAVSAALVATAVIVPLAGHSEIEVETAHGIWPRFRGAGGLGISPHTNIPLEFDARADSEHNLRWKTVTPLPGMSSPVIWNDRVLLTGATENTREVYCFDALSGALLWRRPVSAGPESSEIPDNIWSETGYAAPTTVTDGAHVWALFANGDVICLDLFGQEKWCVNLGLPVNMYGIAASPMLVEDLLLLQIDQEYGSEGPASEMIALDATDGEVRWRVLRDVGSSWPSPIPVETAEGLQVITCANPWTIAYDPESGEEIWRADTLAGDGGPSPSVAEGLVFVVNIGSPLTAIRPDGKGDVTATHVVWEWQEGLPDVCSVIAGNGLVWLLSTDGLVTCLDAATGAQQWDHRFDAEFYASPVRIGDRVLCISRRGEIFSFAAEREYRAFPINHLGEDCDTSPAFAEGRMYIRGRRHLFCIGEGGE
jgi:outer membrane protein assembly factor BamB